jgi:hypothetical protein
MNADAEIGLKKESEAFTLLGRLDLNEFGCIVFISDH